MTRLTNRLGMSREQRIRVTVVVLGDVGRSPRMLYHAVALASGPAEVDVVGYAGTTLPPAARAHQHIRWHFLSARDGRARHRSSGAGFVARAAIKVLGESLQLLWL